MLICSSCSASFYGTERQATLSAGGRRVFCSYRCKCKSKRATYNALHRERLRKESRERTAAEREVRIAALPVLQCRHCGVDVLPKVHANGQPRIYCSDDHRRESENARDRARNGSVEPRRLVSRHCENANCGVAFETDIPHRKFCSKRCKQATKSSNFRARNRSGISAYRRRNYALANAAFEAVQKAGLYCGGARTEAAPSSSPHASTTCHHCGSPFTLVGRFSKGFCSAICRDLRTKERNRTKQAGAHARRAERVAALRFLIANGIINPTEEQYHVEC